ncbi:unnamed protein product [Vitrella brassicaformis CCMP3155]|uniref:Uncharacterized protein n=1 Tax=Vitrella brassicaformis (strain CCMP3155) TaxID=1169540 RepID=A0A0G4H867_VITBC|nr:unnamed protein product [Vitrella brassicaformis CCMP3155]|eukprot:CEM40004.1 unnamed protein product [Vitrella brassicaformis CCMP3155]
MRCLSLSTTTTSGSHSRSTGSPRQLPTPLPRKKRASNPQAAGVVTYQGTSMAVHVIMNAVEKTPDDYAQEELMEKMVDKAWCKQAQRKW